MISQIIVKILNQQYTKNKNTFVKLTNNDLMLNCRRFK